MMILPQRHTKIHEAEKENWNASEIARRSSFLLLVFFLRVASCVFVDENAFAQISTDIIEKQRAALQKQATDPEQKRERGTQPQDWLFVLPDGVTSKQITFYSDGTPCYGRLFFPKGFSLREQSPAVVVGHGINAQAVGIEKYAARFAERGLVALAIDYRTYGYSGGDVLLLEPDTSNDTRAVWEKDARIQIKRTNLNNFRETEDFRAAISYLQTEPGIDPERIGIWGSSNGASVVLMVAALDARVKAVVAQVGAASGLGATGPVAIPAQILEDGIKRARTGQGAEVDGGFSFRSKIDLFSSQVNREFRPAARLDQIPVTTRILWLPVEKDELIPPRSVQLATKAFKGTSQVIELPYLTHFQAYSYAGFEVGSHLAADWFLKYLAAQPGKKQQAEPKPKTTQGEILGSYLFGSLPEGVTEKDLKFYSEGIQCAGKLFVPRGFSSEGKAPAVVLAPDWGDTAEKIESNAARYAAWGLVAMVIDYRGWGKSGGFLQTVDEVKSDDRLRFSQMTTRVRIRRKRILPEQQILDIRNALYFLQGEPGVDRNRIGIWGVGLAGDHALAIAAIDARIKAAVVTDPLLTGRAKQMPLLFGDWLNAEQQRARTGWIASPTIAGRKMLEAETALAMMDYNPFWYIEQIPSTSALLFVQTQKTSKTEVEAAVKLCKGKTEIMSLADAPIDQAIKATAEWFLKNL